jgi:hypothetical protein
LTGKVPCSVSADTFESGRMGRSVEVVGVGIGEEIRGRSESTLLGRICQSTAVRTYGRADVSRKLSSMSAFFAVGHYNEARSVPEAGQLVPEPTPQVLEVLP